MVLKIAIVIGTVIFMECFAWVVHKYIMHGFMWHWHQSQHTPKKGWFEKNDLFGIIFALFSMVFIVFGSIYEAQIWFLVGIGILIYGIFYFLFHDILVHQRIRFRLKINNNYLQKIIRAHHIHHKTHTKAGAEAFGFLYAIKKYGVKK